MTAIRNPQVLIDRRVSRRDEVRAQLAEVALIAVAALNGRAAMADDVELIGEAAL